MDKFLIVAFVIYTLAWEALVWIGGMYVILHFGWSPWWVALLCVMSASQFSVKRFRELVGGAA